MPPESVRCQSVVPARAFSACVGDAGALPAAGTDTPPSSATIAAVITAALNPQWLSQAGRPFTSRTTIYPRTRLRSSTVFSLGRGRRGKTDKEGTDARLGLGVDRRRRRDRSR